MPTLRSLVCVSALLAANIASAQPQDDASLNVAPSDAEALRLRGEEVYGRQCAECHGDRGEGVEGAYDVPLIGDDSVGELAAYIDEMMPEAEPEACVGAEAEAVAAYLHYAFYGEAARVRNRPPRVRLTHLTAAQLRRSLAGLYARFAGAPELQSERGLSAAYYNEARFRDDNKKIERVDETINFDWGRDGPGGEVTADDFGVRWQGGLKVDETGRYEIVVRSTCAFVFDLGSRDREFINNRVQSGDQTEFRQSIFLIAGQVVPLQIDLYQRKRSTEQPPATISLSWIPPGGVERVIPRRNLLPKVPPATFLLQTKLPPDDGSYGYDRGLAIDRPWDDSTTAAAVEFAQAAVDELWPAWRRDHRGEPDESRGVLRSFLLTAAETAFRGPLDEPSRQFYIEDQLAAAEDDGEAIKRSLLVILKSPRFLYPGLDPDRSTSQRAANRLALVLYDSLPSDPWLLEQARNDELQTEPQIRAAAERMAGEYRAQAKTRELLREWLHIDRPLAISKSAEHFPEFNEEIAADLKASLEAFLDDFVGADESDFRELLLADWVYTTPRLAEFYGEAWHDDAATETELAKVSLPEGSRQGLLTHPYLMTRLAYQDSTSPIHRGVFLIRYLLGRTLRPPQEAFTPLSPDLHPDMTTRERVEMQTSPQGCQVCHSKINGLGFTLENFDAVGRFRETEREKKVDPTGTYTTRSGQSVAFAGAAELARFLAESEDAQQAFVNRAFQYFVKQPIAAFGPDQLATLTTKFRESDFNVRRLLVEIAVIAASDPALPTLAAPTETTPTETTQTQTTAVAESAEVPAQTEEL